MASLPSDDSGIFEDLNHDLTPEVLSNGPKLILNPLDFNVDRPCKGKHGPGPLVGHACLNRPVNQDGRCMGCASSDPISNEACASRLLNEHQPKHRDQLFCGACVALLVNMNLGSLNEWRVARYHEYNCKVPSGLCPHRVLDELPCFLPLSPVDSNTCCIGHQLVE